MIHEPSVIATAIDRLNSWVRSDSARRWFCSPRWAIYDWKRHFIKESLQAGRVDNPHAIRLSLACRDCGGSKRYTHSYGETFPWCRRCGSTGAVTLRFLVTTICGFTWHTPENEALRIPTTLLPEDIWKRSTLSVDWEPNQKGIDLLPHQVAEWLNVLEAEYPDVPGKHGLYDYGDWVGEKDHRLYRLYVGKTPEVCAFCKQPTNTELGGGLYGVTRNSIEWSAWCCKPCELFQEGCRPTGSERRTIFDLFPIPVDMIQHPAIMTWLANANRRKTTECST